jgi:hypothetical protein
VDSPLDGLLVNFVFWCKSVIQDGFHSKTKFYLIGSKLNEFYFENKIYICISKYLKLDNMHNITSMYKHSVKQGQRKAWCA